MTPVARIYRHTGLRRWSPFIKVTNDEHINVTAITAMNARKDVGANNKKRRVQYVGNSPVVHYLINISLIKYQQWQQRKEQSTSIINTIQATVTTALSESEQISTTTIIIIMVGRRIIMYIAEGVYQG